MAIPNVTPETIPHFFADALAQPIVVGAMMAYIMAAIASYAAIQSFQNDGAMKMSQLFSQQEQEVSKKVFGEQDEKLAKLKDASPTDATGITSDISVLNSKLNAAVADRSGQANAANN